MSEHEHEPEPPDGYPLDEETVRELDEAGEPEEEPAEPEPAEEPAEPEARGPSEAELRAFERENTRHERALAKLIGEDFAAFKACEECGGVGFVPDVAQHEAEFPAAEGVMECPTCRGEGGTECGRCNGLGGLRYPTKVDGQRLQSCPGCGGSGRLVCVDCAGQGWKHESPRVAEAAPAWTPSAPNGGAGAPPGYILVKVDPNAPDLAPAPAPAPEPEPVAPA